MTPWPSAAWFDPTEKGHWAWLLFGLAIGAGALFAGFDVTESRARGAVVRITSITDEVDRIQLGGTYSFSLIVEKRRDDCENGRVTRHMLEIENGWFYLVERREVLQLEVGTWPFSPQVSTKPLDPANNNLMRPGIWKIISKVAYECPDGRDGEMITRDLVYETPIFQVLE